MRFMRDGGFMYSDDALKAGIIDRIIPSTSEDMLEAATVLALSEEVQNTPVTGRRVSAKKVTVDESLLAKYEQEVMLRNIPHELSLFAAMKAAACSETFEHGMEMEASLLDMLRKTPQSKAKQYHFFNNKRFISPHRQVDPKDAGQAKWLLDYLQREPPQSPIPTIIKPTAPLINVSNVVLMSADARALYIGEMCALQGINCSFLTVRTLHVIYHISCIYQL
jgi:hypothetical protein